MKHRYIKRYLKRGILIGTVIFFITKLLFHQSKNILNLPTERDIIGERVFTNKSSARHTFFRSQRRVAKLKTDDKDDGSLDSSLSKFVDDQEDSGAAKKPAVDKNGPGEMGKPFIVDKTKLNTEEKLEYEKGWKNNDFNEYVSNRISLERTLEDPRDKQCLELTYSENLPEVSIVITFHNEAWSTLLRSIYSILNRTPSRLLREIILVDDFSTMDHLKEPLDEFLNQFRKVKIVRAPGRQGLIRARLLGHQAASGDVLVFLDSHIECTDGWIEPLLDPIARNWSTVMTPVIDGIDRDNFQYSFQSAEATNVGGFDWSLSFTWHPIPKSEKMRRQYKHHLPARSPTMAGGLFAISRKYFEYLGAYDEGMDIWGGENLEISFRIWQCGGTLLTAPCSHVGHVFRKHPPYSWGSKTNVVRNNNVRMAEVWLDDFKEYYYQQINFTLGDYGNVQARRVLREKLQCKSFDWFLVHIYPELIVPAEALYSGEIRSKTQPVCLESPFRYAQVNVPLKVFGCHGQRGNQYWLYTKRGEIRHDLYGCLDDSGNGLYVNSCHGVGGNQNWTYREDNTIQRVGSDKCLELSVDGKTVSIKKCLGTDRQLWKWNRNPPKGPKRSSHH